MTEHDATAAYTHPVHMNFLHKGTTALMVKDGQRILIEAAMDGHVVSPNYGKMHDPKRTHFADHPEKNYINVIILAIREQYYGQPGYDSQRKDNFLRYNDSIRESDGWVFLVDDHQFSRYQRELASIENRLSEDVARVRAALEADLAHAEADLARAREALEGLQ